MKNSIFSSINIDHLIVKNTGTLLISIVRCLLNVGDIEVLNDGAVTSQGAGKEMEKKNNEQDIELR